MMKKKLIGMMSAMLVAMTTLAGCAQKEPAAATAATEQQTTEAPATETPADTTGEGAYDPAAFDASEERMVPGQTSEIDISGCDTFTDIVNKLDDGKGYANATIWETDVLLVSTGTYEWEQGTEAAIDAEIFYYNEDVPTYLGMVTAGGTAYPLSVKDGYLYVAGNHFVTKYLIDGGFLMEVEEGYLTFDDAGDEICYYKTTNSQFEDYDEATAKSNVEGLFNELEEAEVIPFSTVGGKQ